MSDLQAVHRGGRHSDSSSPVTARSQHQDYLPSSLESNQVSVHRVSLLEEDCHQFLVLALIVLFLAFNNFSDQFGSMTLLYMQNESQSIAQLYIIYIRPVYFLKNNMATTCT